MREPNANKMVLASFFVRQPTCTLPSSTKGGLMQAQLNNNEKLLNYLPEFGLNPNDWNLFKVNSKNYVLKNRHDEDLCLLGKVHDDEDSNWQELQWLNL